MSDKQKFQAAEAMVVAAAICAVLDRCCERIEVAGSIRRGRQYVSDVEILFVPKFQLRVNPKDFFEQSKINLADEAIDAMLKSGQLSKRPTQIGNFVWGPMNKLGVDTASGIPVDLFSEPNLKCWFRSLVIRTGSKDTNLELTTGAQRIGWKLHAYGDKCIEDLKTGEVFYPESEAAVFHQCGRPYKKPEDR